MSTGISIYSSIEMDCVARDFSYGDYCYFHKKSNCKGAVLTKNSYETLVKWFDVSYEESEIGKSNPS